MTIEHSDIMAGEVHAPHNWRVTDEFARLALVVTDADLGKYLWQQSDNSEWFLTAVAPSVVWTQHIGPMGPQGPQGLTGATGSTGADGDSAYQVAVANGFVGTEAQWLASLVGPQGEQGIQGVQGEQGPKGDTGATGPAGTTSWAGVTDKPTTITGFGITDAEPAIAAPVSAPTEKYWRGDKTWRDLFTDVRAATLTGLSTATNAVVAATDTVLAAIGKLQAQVSAKADSANVRERLTTPRTYYVRIDGSDSNTGLVDSAGGAFLTLQKALTTIGNLDLGTYDVTVQLGAGTYNASSVSSATVGSGRVIIVGNTSNPSSVILTSSGGVLSFSRGLYRVSGVTLSSTGSSLINSLIGADVEIGNVRFGSAGAFGSHMIADGGLIRTIASYEIFGGGWFHARAVSGGAVRSEIAITVTLTGVPAFTGAFVRGQTLGLCAHYGATFVGTATGARYDASSNGVVFSNGAGATYYPGNAAGTVSTGGQYL